MYNNTFNSIDRDFYNLFCLYLLKHLTFLSSVFFSVFQVQIQQLQERTYWTTVVPKWAWHFGVWLSHRQWPGRKEIASMFTMFNSDIVRSYKHNKVDLFLWPEQVALKSNFLLGKDRAAVVHFAGEENL